MDWVTCPKCGFTQIPTEACLRCSRPFEGLPSRPVIPPSQRAAVPPPWEQEISIPSSERETVRLEPSSIPSPSPEEPVSESSGAFLSDTGAGDKPEAAPSPAAPPVPEPVQPLPEPRPRHEPPSRPLPPATRITPAVIGAGIAILAVVAFVIALAASRTTDTALEPTPAVAAGPAALDLSGRWQAEISKSLPAPSSRPVLKQIYLDTDREGSITGAGVLLTDPGRGGAGAGYRIVADGTERLAQAATMVAASPRGAAVSIDFIPFPSWMPARERAWRAVEGLNRHMADVRYLLLESVEDDYLVQAGFNRSGFLSYAFFSKDYAHDRGLDALSGVIHPDPGSSLRGFRNLVWDLSGSADFLSLEVHATLSGPEGSPDRITLKRGVRTASR